jgi:YD repeat-containing protein
MRQGIIPGDDTVYVVKYDASNRITSIIDSVYEDTLKVTYNIAGKVSAVQDEGWDPATFTYNDAGQLTEIFYEAGEYSERYVFEYTNGVLSKKSEYAQTNANSPVLNLWKYHTYVVTNGNITNMKEYSAADALLSETTFTYSAYPNALKPLSLLNSRNTLGLGDLANHETYFNNNLIASSTVGGVQTTFTYTYASGERLAQFVSSSPNAIYTRMFSY